MIVYSGRQHANEVSSTSHIDKLAEELVTQADKRELLKKVNVVVHPIYNPDGAQLSVDLYKITPDNMLHPGYHGSLSADVSTGQTEVDPIYPESRTRKQLADAWQPDAFLNPHGYPSHEWVQPFSRIQRLGAKPRRAPTPDGPGGFRAGGLPAWAICATISILTAKWWRMRFRTRSSRPSAPCPACCRSKTA